MCTGEGMGCVQVKVCVYRYVYRWGMWGVYRE